MRIFVAVDLPAAIKVQVSAFQEAFNQTRASIKWTRPESLHLTLKFLGEIEESRLQAIVDVVKSVTDKYRPMTLSLKGIGVFPHLSNPRILWVGLEGEADKFAGLAEEIDLGLSGLGFPRDERSYRPHLTIGRFKSPFGAAELMTRAQQDPLPGSAFQVSEVIVMRSVLNPRAAIYTQLFNYPLSGS